MSSQAQHYYWAGGHGLMFFTGMRYLLAWSTFKSNGLAWWYKAAFTGALLSYFIVVKKSLGIPTGAAWLRRALADENFQYFALCVFWLISKPIGIALIPFWTFSTFHVATFTRTTLVPKFFPPTPNPNGQGSTPSPIAKTIQSFVKKYYDPSMKLVAYVELAIFARVLFGLLLWRNSLLMPIIYGMFLRARYFQSPFTRQAFASLDAVILQGLNHPSVHGSVPQAKTYYDMLKTYLGKAVGTVLVPHETAPAAGAGATGGTARPAAGAQ
jgi:hypothetical protein